MAEETLTKRILRAVGETITPIVGSYYYFTRPAATVTDGKQHFAVIDMPTRFRRNLAGYNRRQTKTTGIVYVFSKSKTNNMPNIDDFTSVSEEVEDAFPINGEGFSCTNPERQNMGADDYGCHVSRISFDIFIKKV